MARVAREMVESAGINVDELIGKLVAASGAEFTTFYYYTILRVAAIGMEGEGIKEIIEDARIEDRNHFEALLPRIYELGGELPRDIRDFADGKGFTFDLGMDLTGKTATRKYLARGIPLTFIIDSKGNVVRKAWGQREWDNPLVVDLLNQMIHER